MDQSTPEPEHLYANTPLFSSLYTSDSEEQNLSFGVMTLKGSVREAMKSRYPCFSSKNKGLLVLGIVLLRDHMSWYQLYITGFGLNTMELWKTNLFLKEIVSFSSKWVTLSDCTICADFDTTKSIWKLLLNNLKWLKTSWGPVSYSVNVCAGLLHRGVYSNTGVHSGEKVQRVWGST